MAAGVREANLWVRTEPFQLGILPVSPHPKLALKFLKRIVPYAQNKAQLGYPKLSYSVWKHIACNKLQLPEDIAWMYFVAYRTLHRGRPEIRVQWDSHYAKRTAAHERDHLKSLTTVDTLKFVLLLYLQLYNKITLKANSVLSLSSEEWPKLDSTTESVNRSTSRRALKILDEHHHQAFVSKKLVEMIELLSDDRVRGESGHERTVPVEAVEALSFIIEGSLDCNKSVLPLNDILMSPALHNQVGFVPSKKSFDLSVLVTWIRTKLGFYPFGMSSCLSLGKQMPFGALGLENAEFRNGSMMANTSSGPKGHKYVVLTRFTKQTVAKSSESLKGVGVRIHRCHNSYIYLLVPLKSVVITKCRDTTVVLGPVATTVVVAVCKGLRIISTCRRITICDCQFSIFHLLTPTPPVLIGNHNEAITLAPFHTTYPKLESHMVEVGIGHALNLWDTPLCLSDDGNLENQSCWRLLPADDFYIFNIPFEMEGNTKKIPGNPVPAYQAALKEKKHQVEAWHYLVKSANLDREQRDQLNKLVRARFQAWLILGGHQRELDGLMACAGPKHTRRKEK